MASGASLRRIPWLRALARAALIVVPLLLLLPATFGRNYSESLVRLENYLYDLRLRLTMPGGVDRRVVIVDIDEASIAREGQWPWTRTKLAALLDALFDQYEARVVAFDVQFPEAERASALNLLEELEPAATQYPQLAQRIAGLRSRYQVDERFAESLIARDLILGYAFRRVVDAGQPPESGVLPQPLKLTGNSLVGVPWLEPSGFVGNLPALQANAAAAGFFDTPLTDADGVIRRLPLLQRYKGQLYESLDLATARIALGAKPVELGFANRRGGQRLEFVTVGTVSVPVDERGTMLAPFRGHVNSFPYISASAVIHGEALASSLKNAIVLIGTSAPGLLDIRPTPVDREYIGVEAHANAVAALIDGTVLAQPWWGPRCTFGTLLVLLAFFVLVVPRLSSVKALTGAVLLGVALVALNLVAWERSGVVLPLAVPLIYLIVTSVLLLSYGYFVESRRQRHISRMFGQYIPPQIVQELVETEAEISLEGESLDMSVLFSDVRGFTTISEGLSPRELTQLMNEMLTPLTEVIQRHRGTIDKYMGDAIMAFWGAPLADASHASNAVLAGLEMIECTARIRAQFAERGWPPVHVGVGVSTGMMNVGNMGSKFRAAYTVLGDTVNLGSRLEGLTKQYGVDFIVSGATAAAVPDILFRELDAVRVKGKNEPVAIFEPLGLKSSLDASRASRAVQFGAVLTLYRNRDFAQALRLLEDLAREREEPLVTLYRERVAHFLEYPPPGGWDGVFVHKTK